MRTKVDGLMRAPAAAPDGMDNGNDDRLVLRLYVAGSAPNSARAEANLRALLRDADVGDYDLEVVDCIRDPGRALNDGVIVTPVLLKLAPDPAASIVGSLSDPERVALALGIESEVKRESAHG